MYTECSRLGGVRSCTVPTVAPEDRRKIPAPLRRGRLLAPALGGRLARGGPSAGASSRPRRRGAGIFRRSSGATVGTVQDRTPPKRELSVYIRPATALYGACAASPRRPKTPAEAGVLYDEPCRDRTCDHRIKSPVLYQLS